MILGFNQSFNCKVLYANANYYNKAASYLWLFTYSFFYLFLSALIPRYNNFRIAESLKNVFCSFSVIRFEHRTAGFEVQTLPLCYAVPPHSLTVHSVQRLLIPCRSDEKTVYFGCKSNGMNQKKQSTNGLLNVRRLFLPLFNRSFQSKTGYIRSVSVLLK